MASITARPSALTAELQALERCSPGAHIKSVGLELEGGLSDSGLSRIREYAEARGLGGQFDVHVEPSLDVPCRHPDVELRFWSSSLQAVSDFIRYVYGEGGFMTNTNCGFHIHLKFEDMPSAVSLFSSKSVRDEFRAMYRERFGPTGRYMDRFYNRSCSGDTFLAAEDQDHAWIPYDRESAINLKSFVKHGTIEFRILPNMLRGEEAVGSMLWLVCTADNLYARHEGKVDDAFVTPEAALSDLYWRARNTDQSMDPGRRGLVLMGFNPDGPGVIRPKATSIPPDDI